MKMNRRDLLKNTALVSGAALVGASWPPSKKLFAQDVLLDLPNLPSPANSGIEHIVVVTMENRSFDHFLGWLPNADGKQAGLTFADSAGVSHATHSLSGDYTGERMSRVTHACAVRKRQAGLTFADSAGVSHATHSLSRVVTGERMSRVTHACAVRKRQAGLLAICIRQPSEKMVETPVFHRHHDDVFDSRIRRTG